MQERNGIATAVRALGEKVDQLESDLMYERVCNENGKTTIKRLSEENERLAAENRTLRNKLGAVESYIEENSKQAE